LKEKLQKYLIAFKKLRVDRSHGVAPHKPILLLSILQAIKKGDILSNQIYITPGANFPAFTWQNYSEENYREYIYEIEDKILNESAEFIEEKQKSYCVFNFNDTKDSMKLINMMTRALTVTMLLSFV
jgi:thiamine kinase-like enzyme